MWARSRVVTSSSQVALLAVSELLRRNWRVLKDKWVGVKAKIQKLPWQNLRLPKYVKTSQITSEIPRFLESWTCNSKYSENSSRSLPRDEVSTALYPFVIAWWDLHYIQRPIETKCQNVYIRISDYIPLWTGRWFKAQNRTFSGGCQATWNPEKVKYDKMKKYFSGNLGNFSVGLIEKKKKKTGNIEVCKKETTKVKRLRVMKSYPNC